VAIWRLEHYTDDDGRLLVVMREARADAARVRYRGQAVVVMGTPAGRTSAPLAFDITGADGEMPVDLDQAFAEFDRCRDAAVGAMIHQQARRIVLPGAMGVPQ